MQRHDDIKNVMSICHCFRSFPGTGMVTHSREAAVMFVRSWRCAPGRSGHVHSYENTVSGDDGHVVHSCFASVVIATQRVADRIVLAPERSDRENQPACALRAPTVSWSVVSSGGSPNDRS